MSSIDLHNKAIFVTEATGFIDSNLIKHLCEDVKDATTIGIDKEWLNNENSFSQL